MKRMGGVFEARRYTQYEFPNGGLPVGERAAHALFHYYTIARLNYERETTMIRYEHEKDDGINYRQVMSSVAMMYDTTPENMIKFWKHIDWTCSIFHLPKLPDEERYRFNRPIEVKP